MTTYKLQASGIPLFEKNAGDVPLDYFMNWANYLAATGETILDATVTCDVGITLTSRSFTTTGVTLNLSGGVVGNTYTVKVTVQLASRAVTRRMQFKIVAI